MAERRNYGRTKSGKLLTDELIDELAAKVEAGLDVDEILRRRRGRPSIGSGPAEVESVRLDPELKAALEVRAARDNETSSSIIRRALREYLKVG